jgi:VCBS repeat-containing protein
MRASGCIGRVGGLAIALGVGAAAATGAIGVASAAPADQTSADSAADAGPQATPRARGGADRKPDDTRRKNDRPVSAARPAKPAKPAPAVAPPDPKDLAGPSPTIQAPALTAPPPAVPGLQAPRALRAPAPRLAQARALGTVRAATAPLSTSGPGAPAASTTGWVILAAARRQGRTESLPSAVSMVTTGQTVTADATGADPFSTLLFNQTPTASGTPGGQGAAGVISGSIAVDDPDSDTFAYTVSTKPTYGSVQVDGTGRFTYTPDKAAAHTGVVDQFTVTVSDASSGFHLHGIGGLLNLLTFGLLGSSGHTSTVTVRVTVAPVNAAPTGTVSLGAPDSAGVVAGRVIGADGDGDPLTYTGSAITAKGAVVVNADGRFTYTPTAAARHTAAALSAPAADKADTFTVTVTDSYGAATAVAVTVPVSPANTAPVASATAGDPDASGVVAGRLTATDADTDPLTYSGPAGTAKGAVSVAADGTFTYTPTAAARHAAANLTATAADKSDTFTLSVSDGHGGTATVAVSVPITPVNTAPVGTVRVGAPDPETGVVRGAVTASDADTDPLSYTGTAGTAKGAVVVGADGTFAYTPTAAARHAAASPTASAADQSDAFTITVSDGHGGSAAIPVTVAIGPANTAPAGTVSVGTPNPSTGVVAGRVNGSDPDGDTLSYTGSTTTAKGAVTVGADGTFTYTPTASARHTAAALTATAADKTDTFTVTISDGYGGSTAVPVTVAIAAANAAPVVSASTGAPDAGTGVVTGTVSATDADSDPLTYSASATTAKGAVSVAPNGTFTYTPTATARHAAAKLTAAPADKTDTFTITVSDGHGGSVAVPITVTIAPANAAPTAVPTTGTPDAVTGVLAGALIGADADGDALSYNGSGATAKGTVVVNANGSFTYTPTATARHVAAFPTTAVDGTDTFTVTVADGYGGSVAVPVTVTVSPASVTFNFVYGTGSQYWSTEARTGLQSAATRLASYLITGRPITVSYDVVGEDDSNSPWLATAYVSFTSGSPGYYGTVVQTKVISGTDANGSTADGRISVNFAYPWAFGESVSRTKYDLQSVAMHELMHSLGVITGLGDPSSIDRNWTTYDSFLSLADGTAVIGPTYVWNSAYTPNLTGGNGGLYFAGPNAVSAYGGPVPLYTPPTWTSGSSVVHFDPDFAPPGTTYLMDPSDTRGPGVRTLGAVELGVLTDLGYTVYQPVYALFFVGFLVRRRRVGQAPISERHCGRSETW